MEVRGEVVTMEAMTNAVTPTTAMPSSPLITGAASVSSSVAVAARAAAAAPLGEIVDRRRLALDGVGVGIGGGGSGGGGVTSSPLCATPLEPLPAGTPT